MLKVKVNRETAVKSIHYQAEDGIGVTPVLDDDGDVCDWLRWILAEMTERPAEELDAAGLLVNVDGAGDVVIAVQVGAMGNEVLKAVNLHILWSNSAAMMDKGQ